ncbi:unnamed protein product [Microthlaspi erraticum]|uniref:Uncharacterized protein n=1 Tax=Microthlaspi erraticum TaxID=1685480 RepID=A0A6D2I5R3_9BRAS|nr:unnamed protein product [Microthlaspi erraticum]
MDFIKTSSLRALIELTFQRNWNGLIWMSRKGVITKRVKTVQTALSRISAQPRSPAGRETMFHARPNHIRPSEVSAKVQTDRPITHHDPGNIPRSATPQLTPRRARPCRASREQSLAAAQPFAYHGRCIRPSRETSHVRPRNIGQSITRPTTPADRRIHPATTVPIAHDPTVRPIVPTDRPNAAVDPKPVLKPDFIFSRPGLTLSRLKRPSTIYIAF